jgi:hypothetical protein
MKAYDLMKAVTKNPEKYEGKRYKITKGGALRFNGQNCSEVEVKDGKIYTRNMYPAYFNIMCELEEIQKPVDFMTAANSGRCMKPLHPHEYGANGYNSLAQWLFRFSRIGGFYNRSNALEYMNGQWVIEPEGLEEEGNG